MTSIGTVLIHPGSYFLFVDDLALEKGSLLLCSFENNGDLTYRIRLGPFDLWTPCCMFRGLGKGIEEVLEEYLGADEEEFDAVIGPKLISLL